MHKKTELFNTSIVNLKDLCRYFFIIPTYQRPYVWGEEQLKKILDDFFVSFKSNPNKPYFVGTFLTKEEQNNAELIDGQQRLTTLWLIAFVIQKIKPNSQISNFLRENDQLRFNFEIRTEVKDYLENLAEIKRFRQNKENLNLDKKPYVVNIAKGLTFIKSYFVILHKEHNNVKDFGDFIYNNVKLIKNTSPKNTDLNKLFSVINSAGVQLEQTDIIKANLLSLIDDKVKFSKIWESCENMNNFFERNVKSSFSKTEWDHLNLRNHHQFHDEIFKFENINSDIKNNVFSIDNILLEEIETYTYPEARNSMEKERKSENVYCRSIINFGQLLLHTYRIHLKKECKPDFEGTFHVKRLIEVFKELELRRDAEEIKRFFLLLWDIRFLFDKYIIKWISDINTKTESLELMSINISDKTNYNRNALEKSANLMLQSVLYFTGDYLRQYWLTSYLDYLLYHHSDKSANDNKHLLYLEKIDNIFSSNNNTTDKELSWKIMHQTSKFDNNFNIKEYLTSFKGTSFKHYWFQKLEYLLWKKFKTKTEWEDKWKFNNFRITSKNSVEHIYPQQPMHQKKVLSKNYLDDFGNLVLLSVAQNSEYSNKPVDEKRASFKNKPTFDSLKSYLIFNSYTNAWNEDSIKNHTDEVLKIFKDHYEFDF